MSNTPRKALLKPVRFDDSANRAPSPQRPVRSRARSLAMDPVLLLADEPSGNLDHGSAERLHDLLAELARDLEIGMVVVTHNRSLAARADRVLLLEDGVLAETDVRGVVA